MPAKTPSRRPQRTPGWISATVALGILAALGCQGEAPPPNVLLISADTLRADAVSLGLDTAEGDTPNLRDLALEGTTFANAYAHSAHTAPSHATLFTSLLPPSHAVTRNGQSLHDSMDTLAELLKERGYRTAAISSVIFLDAMYGWKQGFEVFEVARKREPTSDARSCSRSKLEACGEDTTAAALHWLRETWNREEPFFLFVHYYDVHAAYDPPESFKRLAPAHRDRPQPAPWPCQGTRADYAGEVRFLDAQVGRLLDALTELGLAESTLVVFTADHGEAFLEHGYCGHEIDLHEELVRVPLIFRLPDRIEPNQQLDAPVGLVDVTPTILALVGVDGDVPGFEGQDLSPAIDGDAALDPERPILFQRRDYAPTRLQGHDVSGSQFGVRLGRWKYTEAPEEGRRALYDLQRDPGERTNLVGEQPEEAERLARLIAEWREKSRTDGPEPASQTIPEETLKSLRELGYVE